MERFLEEKSEEENKQVSTKGMLFNSKDSTAMERILGKNDLFPISYLQIGLNAFWLILSFSFSNISWEISPELKPFNIKSPLFFKKFLYIILYIL